VIGVAPLDENIPARRLTLTATILLLMLFATAALRLIGTVRVESLADGLNRSGELPGGIDPNSATWWELSHLPGIGETRARQIVEYRESVRGRRGSPTSVVFRSPADLTKVEGIGPTTAERVATSLIFPP
jgi:DNA uptake protein ComE-like DNA-binding protein